jgi:O-antigen biosynthesis protein WbqV
MTMTAGLVARRRRAIVAFAHDVVMAAVSLVGAFALRLGDQAGAYLGDPQVWLVIALFTAVCAGVFWFTGLYRGIWRYASTQDMIAIVRAVTLALLIFLPITFMVTRLEAMPRSVLLIDGLLLVGLLAGPRMAYRVFRDRGLQHLLERGDPHRVPVLLVGAGDAADLFIRDTTRDPNSPYRVVGILDEKGTRVGRNIRGIPVLGGAADVDEIFGHLAARGRAPQRLIQTRAMSPAVLRQLLDAADRLGAQLNRLPSLQDFSVAQEDWPGGRVQLRPVALEDLLQRPQASLDRAAMRTLIEGRCILVTGAGGSIGSELVRQTAEFGASRIVLVDRSEYLLYSIDMDLSEAAPALPRRSVLMDVRDRAGLNRLFGDERPDVVLHAAAVKHVPLAEDNPAEAVITNVVGTRNVCDAAAGAGVGTLVQVSTDKAINPSSVMGGTKRLAECYAQACDLALRGRTSSDVARATRFVTVRFGNVLGSTGSVVPLFNRQIARGGPVTVTHPEMSRFFMTVREAVQLVLQAGSVGAEGAVAEDVGKIYVLDMGEPVKIVELARQMIRLAGLRPGKDIEIAYSGIRPGEKLHEELFHPGEPLIDIGYKGLKLAAARTADLQVLRKAIDDLESAACAGRVDQILADLQHLVPEYRDKASNVYPLHSRSAS